MVLATLILAIAFVISYYIARKHRRIDIMRRQRWRIIDRYRQRLESSQSENTSQPPDENNQPG